MTAVCSRCGAVYWAAQGHSCPRRLNLSDAYVSQAWNALLPELQPRPVLPPGPGRHARRRPQ